MIRRGGFGPIGMLALSGVLGLSAGCAEESSVVEPGEGTTEGVAEAPIVDAKPSAKERREGRKERREGAREARKGHHGMDRAEHGPLGLLRASLDELELTDAQRTTIEGALEGARSAAGDREAPEPPAAMTALVDGVRAGRVDEAAILKLVGTDRPEGPREAFAGALTTLHETLTPAQRRQLVDAAFAKVDAREAHMADRGERGDGDDDDAGPIGKRRGHGAERDGARGPMAHDRGARDGARGPMGREARMGGPMGHLLRGLELSDDQQAQVAKVLEAQRPSESDMTAKMAERKTQHEARRATMRQHLEAFAADRFDASTMLAERPEAPHADHLAAMVKTVAGIVPILDQAQRTALADRLAEGPPRGMKGKHGMKGMDGGPGCEGADAPDAAPAAD